MNRLAICTAILLISINALANNGSSVSDAPKAPAPAVSVPAAKSTIPGMPPDVPSAQPSGDARQGGSAEDLLNSKSSLGRPCRDANGDKVYPSDPDYKAKCAARARGGRRPKVTIPIPGDN